MRRCMIALFVLAILSGTAAPSLAECYGCPAGAWQAEIHMKDGSVREGYLFFHDLWIQSLLKEESPAGDSEWKEKLRGDWGVDEIRLWDRLDVIDPLFEGRCGAADPQQVVFRRCSFRLPRGFGFLVGEGERVAWSEIDEITDRSRPGDEYEIRYPAFRVRRESFQRLSQGVRAAVRYRNGERYVYCFALSDELSEQRLEELCVDERHPGAVSATDSPPWVFESADALILDDDPGT